ncbi:SDR family NAD(P)-dependent oxidoreductase [Pararhizobium mangrovi]|uniref:SDR family oxidoreductase n=1 Tax=Pararhizobium mangrovi TaxID=2590452 RepID=A0A506U2E0_9HYPH|nr:SDR family oxidoreductase [Pararhizobium mangrovi]TPW27155.1 SDR family oxidoreductase [Pararhizobium mangrovi]
MSELPQTPTMRLDGRRALVAGASSGIGFACAAALAEAGAEVTLAARNAERLDEAVTAIREAGHAASGLTLDIADVEAVGETVARAGPYDILVNSAGLGRHSPALETTPADFDTVCAINLRGAYFLAQTVAKGLIEAGKPGSLITISSQMGHVGGVDRAVYCATKHAVEGFTKAMAMEWGKDGIRVNTIAPTFIRTPMTEAIFAQPDKVRWIEEKIRLGRVGEAGDIMGAVLYLASDLSVMVTGTSLRVDGGWTAG